jgi:hypothetical protein
MILSGLGVDRESHPTSPILRGVEIGSNQLPHIHEKN